MNWRFWRRRAEAPGYCVEGHPTSDEMAQRASEALERCAVLERVNRALLQRTEAAEKQAAEAQQLGRETPGAGAPWLTAAQTARLALLVEECGEVAQAAAKVLRHGYASTNPLRANAAPNRVLLEREIGDLRAALDLLDQAGDIRIGLILAHKRRKLDGLGRWMHHQPQSEGSVTP